VGDRSRGRFATPADLPLHDCSPYSHVHARRESLGFVHRSRAILCRPVPNPKVTIRNFSIAVQACVPRHIDASSLCTLCRVPLHAACAQQRQRQLAQQAVGCTLQQTHPLGVPCRRWACASCWCSAWRTCSARTGPHWVEAGTRRLSSSPPLAVTPRGVLLRSHCAAWLPLLLLSSPQCRRSAWRTACTRSPPSPPTRTTSRSGQWFAASRVSGSQRVRERRYPSRAHRKQRSAGAQQADTHTSTLVCFARGGVGAGLGVAVSSSLVFFSSLVFNTVAPPSISLALTFTYTRVVRRGQSGCAGLHGGVRAPRVRGGARRRGFSAGDAGEGRRR
jgi:hypothetical protein